MMFSRSFRIWSWPKPATQQPPGKPDLAGVKGLSLSGLLLAALLATTVDAGQAPLPPEIENEQILGLNKESPHVTLMPYATLDQALAGQRRTSPFARDLNGQWRFNWVGNPADRPADFFKPEFDASHWKEIPVPSSWQLLGYDTPIYSNQRYTFKPDWPRVMGDPPADWPAFRDRNPVGSYRRSFEVPRAWSGRQVFLTFDGVDSAFFLWINGQKVGFSTDSRIPAEFNITKYLNSGGQNLLAVEVYRYSAGSYLECQDMWRLSGIFRNVTLWSAPSVHLRDFFIKTDLDSRYQDASVEVVAKVKQLAEPASAGQWVDVQLFDPAGKAVVGAAATTRTSALIPGQEQELTLKFNVPNPAKWTAETPTLYTAVLKLRPTEPSGAKPTEILSSRVGFRKIEIKGQVFTINGMPVKLKGANRHENWPDTGHYVSEQRMERDLVLLKQVNANHVRTCHYPDDPRWYELCDEYGIYLVGEANIESHGYGYGRASLSNPPEWEKAHVARNVANVETFKNHPSVVIWSLGNEAGPGPNFRAALRAIKALDPSRPTHYERFGTGPDNPCDIDSVMYPGHTYLQNIGKSQRNKPLYLCEYAHAMNNSMGGIGEYNDIFDAYENLMGGAIWEWQDQAIWNRRDPKHPFLAYGGDFGDKPNDSVFILKGVVFADRTPNPKYPEAKKAYQWIGLTADDLAAGKISVKNKYAFTDLAKFQPAWSLSEDGIIIARGELPRFSLAPGQSGVLSVPWSRNIQTKPGAEYLVRVTFSLAQDERWAKRGYEVASEQFSLPPTTFSSNQAQSPASPRLAAIQVDEGASSVRLSGQNFRLVFDKTAGTFSEWSVGGQPVLKPGGGPLLYAYRAPHLNDDLWAAGAWRSHGLDQLQFKPTQIEIVKPNDRTVQIRVSGSSSGTGSFAFHQTLVYTVYGDGSLALDLSVLPNAQRFVLPRLGVRLLLDSSLESVTYYGRGPLENYPDRKRGSDIAQWTATTHDLFTPYAATMECGNHEDVRWVALRRNQGSGLFVKAEGATMAMSALPYRDEELAAVKHPHELAPSSTTVLCLSARTLGVGSAGCGPQPLPQYVIRPEPLVFSCVLRPLPAGVKDLAALARQPLPARVKPVLAERTKDGRLTLTSATPGATILCGLNGAAENPYSAPIELKDGGRLKFSASAPGHLPFAGELQLEKAGSRGQWKIVGASSYEPGEGEPAHAIDGDPETFWHSRWSSDEAKPPHWLVIDLGKPTKLSALTYTARGDSENGRVRDYEVYLSADGKDWGTPAASGRLRNNTNQQTIPLKSPSTAQFVKFVALNETRGNPWASVAELEMVPAE